MIVNNGLPGDTTDSAPEDTSYVPGYDHPVMCTENSRCLEDENADNVCMCNDDSIDWNGECYNPSVDTDGMIVLRVLRSEIMTSYNFVLVSRVWYIYIYTLLGYYYINYTFD